MATIVLNANRINQMSSMFKYVKDSVITYQTELFSLKAQLLAIGSSVCYVDDTINAIQTSTQIQEKKTESLDVFIKKNEEYIADVDRIDYAVASLIHQSNNEFNKTFAYSEGKDKKSLLEWAGEKLTSVGEWCKKLWKSFWEGVAAVAEWFGNMWSNMWSNILDCLFGGNETAIKPVEPIPIPEPLPSESEEEGSHKSVLQYGGVGAFLREGWDTGIDEYTGIDEETVQENSDTDSHSEQNAFMEEQLVTMKQMEDFGFKITEEELIELNHLLKKYGVEDKGSIALFMATCGHESGKGTQLMEGGTPEYWEAHGYDENTRGAGYIQVTGEDQLQFYKYMGLAAPVNRTKDIAENYAWEASLWEWAVQKKGKGVYLNDYVTKHGPSEEVFLITQYFINGYVQKNDFDNDLRYIREGGEYEIDIVAGTLTVNKRTYRLPINYKDRKENYNLAMKIFMED